MLISFDLYNIVLSVLKVKTIKLAVMKHVTYFLFLKLLKSLFQVGTFYFKLSKALKLLQINFVLLY